MTALYENNNPIEGRLYNFHYSTSHVVHTDKQIALEKKICPRRGGGET